MRSARKLGVTMAAAALVCVPVIAVASPKATVTTHEQHSPDSVSVEYSIRPG